MVKQFLPFLNYNANNTQYAIAGFIVPEEKVYDKETVLYDLYNCLYALNHAADKIDPTVLITSLPLGDVTKLELLHFVFYHINGI